jgi:hypothetical protein
LPWLARRNRGWFSAFFATIGLALIGPYRLMRGLPADSPAGDAWKFAILSVVPASIVSLFCPSSPFCFFGIFGAGALGAILPNAPPAIGIALAIVGVLCTPFVYMLMWGWTVRAILHLTGRSDQAGGRVMQALCYSSGAYILSAIPCAGGIGYIWWLVSAVLTVKEGQKIGGGRAAFAVLTFPLLVLGALIGLMAYGASSPAWTAGMQMAGADVQTVLDAVLDHAENNSGIGPAHAIQLVTGGQLNASDLIGYTTGTSGSDIPIGGKTLNDFELLAASQQILVQQKVLQQMPKSVVAHRLGDFVFVHHGIDLSTCDGQLWVVIFSPDPDTNSANAAIGQDSVGLADGSVTTFPMGTFSAELAKQNKLRADNRLPPLPDPAKVTHAQPAVAATPPASQPASTPAQR